MQITIKGNRCHVTDATHEELKKLRDALTVDTPGAKYSPLFRSGRWDGKKRFFNALTRSFPLGFLAYLRNFIQLNVTDERTKPAFDPVIPTLNGIELRDYQKQAVEACFSSHNCIIQAATNAGKTAIFSAVLKQMAHLKCLVLVHREELFWQTKENVEDFLGCKIGVICAREVKLRNITIAMVTTLANRYGKDESITEWFNEVQCVVVDECHHASSPTYGSVLSSCRAVYRFGFSGTVADVATLNGFLVRQWLGDVGFIISNKVLIEQGVSALPKIKLHEVDHKRLVRGLVAKAKASLPEKTPMSEVMKEVYRMTVQDCIVNNQERNLLAVKIIKEYENKSILLVVDLIEHGENLEKLLKAHNINCAFISGLSEVRVLALQSFKAGMLKVLISTNIIDEGVDINRIEVLVMMAGRKSKRQTLQRIGRGLRRKEGVNEVSVHDFYDFGSRHLEKHSKERVKIYKDEGFDVGWAN